MRTVGPTDPALFDNPTAAATFRAFGDFDYASVFDFGCGCGRIARQMMQQECPPARYLGIDLHADAVVWCQQNLIHPSFSFCHLDVRNVQFNPHASACTLPFPAEDNAFTLAVAVSVFTHVLEPHVDFFLGECSRLLRPGGTLLSSWFTFDKALYPMMQAFQNALYINAGDPTNAVIYDREFIFDLFARSGLGIVAVFPPSIRGFQWMIVAEKGAPHRLGSLPEDDAPMGLARGPL